VGSLKRKQRETKQVTRRNERERKEKAPPRKTNNLAPKGRLPDPTYSRMKSAYRTTLADVDHLETKIR